MSLADEGEVPAHPNGAGVGFVLLHVDDGERLAHDREPETMAPSPTDEVGPAAGLGEESRQKGAALRPNGIGRGLGAKQARNDLSVRSTLGGRLARPRCASERVRTTARAVAGDARRRVAERALGRE